MWQTFFLPVSTFSLHLFFFSGETLISRLLCFDEKKFPLSVLTHPWSRVWQLFVLKMSPYVLLVFCSFVFLLYVWNMSLCFRLLCLKHALVFLLFIVYTIHTFLPFTWIEVCRLQNEMKWDGCFTEASLFLKIENLWKWALVMALSLLNSFLPFETVVLGRFDKVLGSRLWFEVAKLKTLLY
jgi:hypothetical protein